MFRQLSAVALLAATLAPGSVSASGYRGYASIYNPGVMGSVSRNRGLPLVGCMVATPLASRDKDIGRWVTVTSLVTGERARCRVTDVVRKRDMRAHLATSHLVEFDNPTGLRMCKQAYAGQLPRRSCPVRIIL